MSEPRTINSLQVGRGLAALAVVCHHSQIAAHDFGGTSVPLLSYGYLGVDFFFVLSGFIIFHSTVGRGKTIAEYSVARFRRIYLPYWPVGIAIGLLYTALPHLSAADRDWSWLTTITLLPLTSGTALSVAWTLKHEILFYLVFGGAYFTRVLWPTLILWAVLIGVATIAFGPARIVDTTPVPLRSINFEFLFGVVAAFYVRRGLQSPWLLLATVGSWALWLVLGASRDLSFLVGLGIAFAIPPMVGAEWRGRLRPPASLVFLGAASYALYLAHPLFTPIAGRLLRGHGWAILAVGIAGSLAVGVAYHLWVELPLLRIATPVLRRLSPRLAPTLPEPVAPPPANG
jgi:exopolysaccharide production protein ExoZ